MKGLTEAIKAIATICVDLMYNIPLTKVIGREFNPYNSKCISALLDLFSIFTIKFEANSELESQHLVSEIREIGIREDQILKIESEGVSVGQWIPLCRSTSVQNLESLFDFFGKRNIVFLSIETDFIFKLVICFMF